MIDTPEDKKSVTSREIAIVHPSDVAHISARDIEVISPEQESTLLSMDFGDSEARIVRHMATMGLFMGTVRSQPYDDFDRLMGPDIKTPRIASDAKRRFQRRDPSKSGKKWGRKRSLNKPMWRP